MIVGSVQLHQSLDGILHLGHEDHSGNDIGLVGSLFVQRNDVSIEAFFVDFCVKICNFAHGSASFGLVVYNQTRKDR